jgi:thiol-disulfide isomerase/thioredoxin
MGTKQIRLTIAFVLLFSSALFAAKTTIKGYAPGAENLEIRLYKWDDYISFREVLIARAPIDSTGHFSIALNVFDKQVIMSFFRIMDFISPEIYIPAGKTYNIEFEKFDYKDPSRIYVPLLSSVSLKYTLKNNDSTDINSLIGKYNYDLSNFLMKLSGMHEGMQAKSIMRPPKTKIDSFAMEMNAKYIKINNDFFHSYFTYSLANLQLTTYSRSKKSLFDNFLYKKPILYDNVSYMDFFSNYFTDFIYGVSKKIPPYDIIVNVNHKTNLTGLIDSLGKDTLLRNEQIREAVLLLNIRDWYTSATFEQDSLIKILHIYTKTTKFDLQGRIAENLAFMLTRYKTGAKLPEFEFKSIDDEKISRDSLYGKYTFMFFFTTWSHACLSELQVVEKLQNDWSDSIRFVAVSMDREPLKLYYFLQENAFSFPFYSFNGYYEIAEQLSIKTYPHCMLLAKDGSIIDYCTPIPSEGVVELFDKIAGEKVVTTQSFKVGQ